MATVINEAEKSRIDPLIIGASHVTLIEIERGKHHGLVVGLAADHQVVSRHITSHAPDNGHTVTALTDTQIRGILTVGHIHSRGRKGRAQGHSNHQGHIKNLGTIPETVRDHAIHVEVIEMAK